MIGARGRVRRRQAATRWALALCAALHCPGSPRPATAAEAALAHDTFTRVVGVGWGTAERGGAYSYESGSGAFSVGGTVGSVALAKPGANRAALLTAAL